MKLLSTLLLSCLTTVAIADTTLTFTNKKDKVVMEMQFANNLMRTSNFDGESFAIYDGENTTFTVVTADSKQYFVMDKETLESFSDLEAMMEKMLEKQLGQMPAEQREMMRGMMSGILKSQLGKQMEPPIYKFTGKNKSYNGFDCQVVTKKAKRKKSEFCVTDYGKVGMSNTEYDVIRSFQKIMQSMSHQINMDSSMDFSMLGDYIPVKYNQMGESGHLKSVSHDNIDPSMFAIPAGYEKMEMPF